MYVSRIFGHVSRHEIHKALQFKDHLPRTPVKMYLLVAHAGGTAGRRGGRRAQGPAQAHREARGLRGAHVAARTTRAWAESNTPSSGRQRAGAIGGGTDASWRCRRIRVITD